MADGPVIRLKTDAVVWRAVEGEIVALDLRDSMYLAINRTGAVLWPALAEGTTHEELVNLLVGSFEVDRVQATADLDAFLDALGDRGLVETT